MHGDAERHDVVDLVELDAVEHEHGKVDLVETPASHLLERGVGSSDELARDRRLGQRLDSTREKGHCGLRA